jgi:hypothetical protein
MPSKKPAIELFEGRNGGRQYGAVAPMRVALPAATTRIVAPATRVTTTIVPRVTAPTAPAPAPVPDVQIRVAPATPTVVVMPPVQPSEPARLLPTVVQRVIEDTTPAPATAAPAPTLVLQPATVTTPAKVVMTTATVEAALPPVERMIAATTPPVTIADRVIAATSPLPSVERVAPLPDVMAPYVVGHVETPAPTAEQAMQTLEPTGPAPALPPPAPEQTQLDITPVQTLLQSLPPTVTLPKRSAPDMVTQQRQRQRPEPKVDRTQLVRDLQTGQSRLSLPNVQEIQRPKPAPIVGVQSRGVAAKFARMTPHPWYSSARVFLTPGNGSDVDPQLLRCPEDGVAAYVEEIRWTTAVSPAAGATPIIAGFGGLIACTLVLVDSAGNEKLITGRSIPLGAFGNPMPFASIGAVGIEVWTDGVLDREEYVWRLPEALYIPVGSSLAMRLEHNGLLSYPVAVQASYSGVTAPGPKPKTSRVPYITAWIPNSLSVDGTERSVTSTPQDLYNPFSGVLHCERMSGRVYQQLPQVAAYQIIEFCGILEETFIQMSDSLGHQIVRDDAIFWEVFCREDRGWNLSHELPPGAYYTIQLKCGSVNQLGNVAYPVISLSGWREEAA